MISRASNVTIWQYPIVVYDYAKTVILNEYTGIRKNYRGKRLEKINGNKKKGKLYETKK